MLIPYYIVEQSTSYFAIVLPPRILQSCSVYFFYSFFPHSIVFDLYERFFLTVVWDTACIRVENGRPHSTVVLVVICRHYSTIVSTQALMLLLPFPLLTPFTHVNNTHTDPKQLCVGWLALMCPYNIILVAWPLATYYYCYYYYPLRTAENDLCILYRVFDDIVRPRTQHRNNGIGKTIVVYFITHCKLQLTVPILLCGRGNCPTSILYLKLRLFIVI